MPVIRTRQRGVAVIVAMLIVTLAASTAAYALWQQSVSVRLAESLRTRAQADALAAGAIDLARGILAADDKANVDDLSENWARPLPALAAEGAVIAGQIVDEQGKLNLNNLAKDDGTPDEAQHKVFAALLNGLGLREALADVVLDWIDGNDEPSTAESADTQYYLAQTPPRYPPNRSLMNLGELAGARGFDPEVLARLAPFVTALPRQQGPTRINVNTALEEVLAAVLEGQPGAVQEIFNRRKNQTPIAAIADLAQLQNAPQAAKDMLGTSSGYFLAEVRVNQEPVTAGYRALLYRQQQQGQPGDSKWPVIIWRQEAVD